MARALVAVSLKNARVTRDHRTSIIRTEQLTKRFGEVTAVDAVSFAVERGAIFAFLGPNGAGKSTTIRMLTTLLTPTSGHIEVDGHDPTRDPAAVRRTFGIIFQDPNLDTELWQGPASENGRSVNVGRPLILPIGNARMPVLRRTATSAPM